MAAFACIFDRNLTALAVVSTVAVGLMSTFAIWARTRTRRAQTRANEMECRYMVASWMADPEDPAWVLFEEDARGKTPN